MSTQPFWSTESVKKSPSRRSCPVATHVVPLLHIPPVWMGKPTGSVGPRMVGVAVGAWNTLDSSSETLPEPLSGLVVPSYWYLTTATLPAPAAVVGTATHGQSTLAPGAVMVIGAVNPAAVFLRSKVDSLIALSRLPALLVVLLSQTRYTMSLTSMPIDGQCAKEPLVPGTSNCWGNWVVAGLANAASALGRMLMPMPALLSLLVNRAGSMIEPW